MTVAGIVASAINVFEHDAARVDAPIHPVAVNLGAAISVATFKLVNGAELLSAFAIGCELEIRLALALGPGARERGWDLNGVCGTLSAAVTASLLVDSQSANVANAIEVASSCTLGLEEAGGSDLKLYTSGKAAQNGVTSALLASTDFSGPRECFESPRGLGQALVQRMDAFESVTSALASLDTLEEIIVDLDQKVADVREAASCPAEPSVSLIRCLGSIDKSSDIRELVALVTTGVSDHD